MLTLNKIAVTLTAGLTMLATANVSASEHNSLLILTVNHPQGVSVESVQVPTVVCEAIGTQWVTESKESTNFVQFIFTCAPLEPKL